MSQWTSTPLSTMQRQGILHRQIIDRLSVMRSKHAFKPHIVHHHNDFVNSNDPIQLSAWQQGNNNGTYHLVIITGTFIMVPHHYIQVTRTHGRSSAGAWTQTPDTIDSRYIAVMYDTIMHTAQQIMHTAQQMIKLRSDSRLRMPNALWDVFREWYKKMAAIYQERTVFNYAGVPLNRIVPIMATRVVWPIGIISAD